MSMSIRILTVLALVGGLALTACKKSVDTSSSTSGTSTPPATTDTTSGGSTTTTTN